MTVVPTYVDPVPSLEEYMALNAVFACAMARNRTLTEKEREVAFRYIQRLRAAMDRRHREALNPI